MANPVAFLLRDAPAAYRRPLRFLKLYLFGQGYRLLLNYRLGRALTLRGGLVSGLAPFLRRAQYRKWGCDISFRAELGDGIRFPHPLGVVIGEGVVVGDGAKIFQQVTIGSHGRAERDKAYPCIGRDVTLYAGAKILGPVVVGDGAIVGANAVVTRDIPAGARAVGAPARPL